MQHYLLLYAHIYVHTYGEYVFNYCRCIFCVISSGSNILKVHYNCGSRCSPLF